MAGNGRVSGFGKGGGNLIPVHLERGGISWHSVTSSTERKTVTSYFHLVLWGNIKGRPPQVPPFELSPLRADVARGQYGLE